MDWLDSVREQLGHMAELRDRVTAIGAGWLDSLQQLAIPGIGGLEAERLYRLADRIDVAR